MSHIVSYTIFNYRASRIRYGQTWRVALWRPFSFMKFQFARIWHLYIFDLRLPWISLIRNFLLNLCNNISFGVMKISFNEVSFHIFFLFSAKFEGYDEFFNIGSHFYLFPSNVLMNRTRPSRIKVLPRQKKRFFKNFDFNNRSENEI